MLLGGGEERLDVAEEWGGKEIPDLKFMIEPIILLLQRLTLFYAFL